MFLVCEDELSEVVMKKMVRELFPVNNLVLRTIRREGRGYIKSRINEFNNQSNMLPFFILADLDTDSCAPGLIGQWLKRACRKNLVFRIAVREVESWLLADTYGFANYLGLEHAYILKEVNSPEDLWDPKEKLISIVDHSRKRDLKSDIVGKKQGGGYRQGPGYNTRLAEYIMEYWDIGRAAKKTDSLQRALKAVLTFHTDSK